MGIHIHFHPIQVYNYLFTFLSSIVFISIKEESGRPTVDPTRPELNQFILSTLFIFHRSAPLCWLSGLGRVFQLYLEIESLNVLAPGDRDIIYGFEMGGVLWERDECKARRRNSTQISPMITWASFIQYWLAYYILN